MHRLGIAGLVIAFSALPAAAQASWLTAGTGDGSAQATSVDRANAPVADRADGKVSLTWQASGLASGSPVAGYDVIRHVAGGPDVTVCSYVATTSCTDPAPQPGMVSYGVVARIGDHWAGPESPTTGFQYDVYAPTTTVIRRVPSGTDDSWANQDVAVTLAATDPGPVASGVAAIHYKLNGGTEQTVAGSTATVTVTQAQVNTLTFWAVDQLGNAETAHDAQVRIDETAPTSSGSLKDSLATLTASDDASGVAAIVYRVGTASTWTTYTTPFTLSSGQSIAFHAIDNAGNVESPDHSLTDNADVTAPSLAFFDLVADRTYGNNSGANTANPWSKLCDGTSQICVTATDASGVDAATVRYALEATSGTNTGKCWAGSAGWLPKTGSSCATVPMTAANGRYEGGVISNGSMKTGDYTVTVWAKDAATPANEGSASLKFKIS